MWMFQINNGNPSDKPKIYNQNPYSCDLFSSRYFLTITHTNHKQSSADLRHSPFSWSPLFRTITSVVQFIRISFEMAMVRFQILLHSLLLFCCWWPLTSFTHSEIWHVCSMEYLVKPFPMFFSPSPTNAINFPAGFRQTGREFRGCTLSIWEFFSQVQGWCCKHACCPSSVLGLRSRWNWEIMRPKLRQKNLICSQSPQFIIIISSSRNSNSKSNRTIEWVRWFSRLLWLWAIGQLLFTCVNEDTRNWGFIFLTCK